MGPPQSAIAHVSSGWLIWESCEFFVIFVVSLVELLMYPMNFEPTTSPSTHSYGRMFYPFISCGVSSKDSMS